ncbi:MULTISPECIES: hypothetical protein [Nocardioides]|uniref:Uncharacterized protein n=1 Tax=Nocardioides vastitatis TaxID=2568655 RepID=A0ABW0ZLN4_9ACTN|nr:hypothetical protein [Nocardioides sp.]THJ13714.1 hypothetical protein E7Z54_01515 [Nocardioides sp.]
METLRNKAARIAAQLRDAEAVAEQAVADRKSRNAERRAAFWANAGDRCTAAHERRRDARTAVVDLVAGGDLVAALAAYGDYLRRSTEADVVVRLAQDATREYVYSEKRATGTPVSPSGMRQDYPTAERVEVRTLASEYDALHAGPPRGHYETVYADGVPHSAGDRPESFTDLLTAGTGRLTESHRAAFTAELLAPLLGELEPED